MEYENLMHTKSKLYSLRIRQASATYASAGVPKPGLNWALNPQGQGGGLKILWRRPSRVQIPPPALTFQSAFRFSVFRRQTRGNLSCSAKNALK